MRRGSFFLSLILAADGRLAGAFFVGEDGAGAAALGSAAAAKKKKKKDENRNRHTESRGFRTRRGSRGSGRVLVRVAVPVLGAVLGVVMVGDAGYGLQQLAALAGVDAHLAQQLLVKIQQHDTADVILCGDEDGDDGRIIKKRERQQ